MDSNSAQDGPRIVGAELSAAHDGQPELILKIRYENGVLSDVTMENELGVALVAHCGSNLQDLIGQPWHTIMTVLGNNT